MALEESRFIGICLIQTEPSLKYVRIQKQIARFRLQDSGGSAN